MLKCRICGKPISPKPGDGTGLCSKCKRKKKTVTQFTVRITLNDKMEDDYIDDLMEGDDIHSYRVLETKEVKINRDEEGGE